MQAPAIEALLGEVPRRVRCFDPSDLHVTVAFLGSVDRAVALTAWKVAETAALERVRGTFGGIKVLGNPRRPTAVSAVVDDGHDALCRMIDDARSEMLLVANAPEDLRPPLPHVTLARIQRRASRDEYRLAVEWAQGLRLEHVPFAIDQVALYTWAQDRRTRLFDIVANKGLS